MKHFIKVAFKIFIYLSIAFTVAYWIYIIIDDYVFIEKYWTINWLDYIALWFLYYVIYYVGFSIYYWAIVFTTILIYYKILPRIKR